MSKRKIQNIDREIVKKQKIDNVPNEIIIKIFKYFIDDLFNVEYDGVDIIKISQEDINTMRSIFLSSKNFNGLFKKCFEESFKKKFEVEIKVFFSENFWTNLVYCSVLELNNWRSKHYFYMIGHDYPCYDVHEILVSYQSLECELYSIFEKLYFLNFFEELSRFHVPNWSYVNGEVYCDHRCKGVNDCIESEED